MLGELKNVNVVEMLSKFDVFDYTPQEDSRGNKGNEEDDTSDDKSKMHFRKVWNFGYTEMELDLTLFRVLCRC